MTPRLRHHQTIRNDSEAFDLDIVDCKQSYEAEAFMTEKFHNELFKFPFLSIIFVPKDKVCSLQDFNNFLLNLTVTLPPAIMSLMLRQP